MTKRERRRLLRNVESLVERPDTVSIQDMAQIMTDLGQIYSEKCGQAVLVVPVIDHAENRKHIELFKST